MEPITPLQRLWKLISSEKKEIAAIYFYAVMSGLVQLSVPLGIQAIISYVLGASMVTSIFVLIILVVTGVLLVGIFQLNQMKIIEKIQQRIFTYYSFSMAENIPKFDLKQTDKYYLPEKTNRFFDIMNIQKGFSKLLLDIPVAIIQILLGLLLLSVYHPFFIGLAVLLILILLITGITYSKRGITTSIKESNYKYAVASWLEEMARVIKSFKFSQGSHLNLIKTDKEVSSYLDSRTAHFKILMFQYKTLIFFKVFITAALLSIGSFLLLNQQLNIGEFIAAEIVILMVINGVEKMIINLENVYDVITGLEKISSVIELPTEQSGSLKLDVTQGLHIEIRNLSFEFESNERILHNINLDVLPFKTICISGPDNSGKSTLLKLLNGGYSDFSGSILLNNIPITNYNLEDYRHKAGIYLNSSEDLFNGSLYENISMGKSEVQVAQISELANTLGIEDIFNNMTNGYETRIEPIGHKLSSNVVKKILLLRAFINNPSLLLLENPFQGLDEGTKSRLKNYINTIKNKATIFIICNDPTYISSCDMNVDLENGRIKNLQINR